MKNKYLVTVVGPTAVGKTAFSVALARHFKTSVLSADSRQLYKELTIGTAKPSEKEMEGIPHFFIGNRSVKEMYTVADFEKDALACLDELFASVDVVIVCGGTGLYVDALCNGMDELPDRDDTIRQALSVVYKSKGIEGLQEKLKELDPVHFANSDTRNPHRMMRALEICLLTGKPYSEVITGKKKKRDFSVIKIGLNMEREELYKKINSRVDAMIGNGLVAEAKELYILRGLNALQTVGYKELFDHFENKTSLDEAVTLIGQHSRNYAKRQLTWFRRDALTRWFEPGDVEESIVHIGNEMKQ